MLKDSIFEMATSNLRFGPGSTAEVGMDLVDLGARNVLVVADPQLARLPPLRTVVESLEAEKITYRIFDQVRIEPTDASFKAAIAAARSLSFDALVAIGGGSTIDTAKAANLYTCYPADFLDYVNAPIGKGLPVPGPLKPLVAIPTTAGTGSETTGVAIFDLVSMKAKTGIAHRNLKPTLGVIDPRNTRTLPAAVAACTGLDVLSHALESYTAIPFNQRPHPGKPSLRPAYQGNNPISDVWSLEALRLVAKYLVRAVENPEEEEARGKMLLAAAYAGMGFGNAGVHLPHGMSYPVAGMVRDFVPAGYGVKSPLVPHGMSVILNAPAVFRFTAAACPERHRRAAKVLDAEVDDVPLEAAGSVLAQRLIDIMRQLGMPNGLSALGYTSKDIPVLVQATLPQHRVTKLSPRPAGEKELTRLFQDALTYW